MSNTITAYFKGRVGVAESVYQNDYGIVMEFDSIVLPTHFDCYFSKLNQEEAVPAIGADNRVVIPNSILADPGNMTIHIPLHTGESDSEVEYVIYFKVIGRARPIDDGTPAQMTAIEQALALLQNPITNIEQIVNEALDFTGDTFDEMQAKLDADQTEFEDEMQAKQTEFESEINSDFEQLNSQFNNLATNVKANSVNTLWTGTLKAKNDSATLSESVANFDYIDIYTGSTDNRCVRKKVSDLSSVVRIQGQNLYDLSGGYGLAESEIHLSVSGTTATIVKTINFSWNGEADQAADSSADVYDVECPIIRIDGVKIGSHESAELTDIRVGADGITDTTAGASVRRQFSDLKSEIGETDDAFSSFAYGLKHLTQFTTGTYKWYQMTLANGTQIALKTLDNSTYINGALLLYDSYAGTQLGTIYPTVIGDTAYFTVDKDNVTYIRTGSDFSHGATNVYLVVNGLNASQKIDELEAQANASTSDIRHLFGFEFGDINSSGAFVASQRRMATPNMQHYDYDIIIPKRNGYTACGLCVYDDASGTNPRIVGLVNRYYDYLLKAGTYFRFYIYNPDNTQNVTGKPYDNLIYNDFHAYNRDASEAFVHSGDYKDNYLYNRNVRSVCHRGASRTAPENTLPAFIEARRWGFEWVEADIAWTADSVPVILHDTTIDRTSDGSGSISSLTYDQIKNLDFGSWFSSEYEGTKIPKLEELMQLCRKVGLKARLDINHTSTGTQLEDACRLVVRNGMKDNVEFIGYDVQTLERIKTIIPTATLIYLVNTVNSQAVTDALSLKTDNNEVHLLTQTINSTIVELCANALIPLEYWTAGTFDKILELDPYVTVVTAEDSYAGIPLVAGSILYKSVIY